MKRLASWSAILAVAVLALGTAAQAATVAITLSFDKTSGIAVGDTVNWQLTAQVFNNTWVGFNCGIESLSVGIDSTNEVGMFPEGFTPVPPPGSYTGAPSTSLYNVAPAPDGFGGSPQPMNPAYTTNGGIAPVLIGQGLKNPAALNPADYGDGTAGNTDYTDLAAKNKLGNGAPIIYASGSWKATADGTTTFTPYIVAPDGTSYNMYLLYVNETTYGLGQFRPVVGDVSFNSVELTVGTVTTNNPPTATIDTAAVAEGDWTGPSGWNNPGRSVAIAATTGDQDGDSLTYDWKITAPASEGGAVYDLGQNVEDLTLTIQMLIDAGVPLPADGALINTNPENYTYGLQLFAFDGTDTTASNSINVFVPEPATIGLLGFGVVGLLKRRRRA